MVSDITMLAEDSNDFEFVSKPDSNPALAKISVLAVQTRSIGRDQPSPTIEQTSQKLPYSPTADWSPHLNILIKLFIVLSLPSILTWTALSALLKACRRLSSPDFTNEEVLEPFTRAINTAINTARDRLHWVDHHYPTQRRKYAHINFDCYEMVHGMLTRFQ